MYPAAASGRARGRTRGEALKVVQVAYKAGLEGGERVLLQLGEGLRAAGDAVEVVVREEGPLAARLRERGIPVHLLPLANTYDLPGAIRLAGLLRDCGADLVHSHGFLVNVLARLARPLVGVRVVGTVHLTRSLAAPDPVLSPAERWKARLWYRPVDNASARLADAIVAVSDAVRDDLVTQGVGSSRVRVIRNGIDPARFDAVPGGSRDAVRAELGVGPGEVLLGMTARLSVQKDVGCFLRAAELLAASGREFRAFVAGDGPQREELGREVQERGLAARVRFLGFRDDVPSLLRAADVAVLSSRWEGLPLSPLEAMAARLPVVATAVPGTREAVVDGETGRLVPVGDAAALAVALGEVLDDPARRQAMGEAGRRRVERDFSVARVVAEHRELYREVLASSR